MGLAEILPKYFHLKRRIRECAEAVLADPPDLLLTIDSPDFCLRGGQAGEGEVADPYRPLRRPHGLGLAPETRREDGARYRPGFWRSFPSNRR